MIRKGILICAALLLCLAWTGAAADGSADTQRTGYFTETVFVRPGMILTTDYVDKIPAYTVVTLEALDETWAAYPVPGYGTGYVRYGKIQPVPEPVPDPESYVYSENRIEVRNLPIYDSQTVYRTEPWELLTVDGHVGGFAHVTTADGTGGYIIPAWVRKAEFSPVPIAPVTLCVAEETPGLDMPLRGAHPTETLTPDRFYRAEEVCGNYYGLALNGKKVYVEILRTALCAFRGGESRTFFTVPRAGGQARMNGVETIYAGAIVSRDGAALVQTDGEERLLSAGTRGYVYTACGGWVGASFGDLAGYLRREDVEIQTGAMLRERLRKTDLSGGRGERSIFLDQALAMLEEGNPFQARYNLLTGAEIQSVLPLGVPYFWGGRSWNVTVERLPNYTTRAAWQSSPVYYRKGTVYLYGFDCIGFVKSVYSRAGKPMAGSVTGRRAWAYCQAGEHVYCDTEHPLPADWTEAARTMKAGDILVVHHPGTHAMMYMGTLRDYGYTAEQLPALAEYLDYPLMMQAGENPYCYFRFQSLISASPDRRTAAASPPDGGVSVCILGVPKTAAEMRLTCHGATYDCFDVEGSCVTRMDFDRVTDYFVYRMRDGAAEPEAPEESPEEMDETEAAGDEA